MCDPIAVATARSILEGSYTALLQAHRLDGARSCGGADLAAEMLGHTSSDITKQHYIGPDDNVNPVSAEILESLARRKPEGNP
ncbi:MAG: hypothetical protein ABI873_18510 [Marmoricola sp.]